MPVYRVYRYAWAVSKCPIWGSCPPAHTPSTIPEHFHFSTQETPLTSTSTLGTSHFPFPPKKWKYPPTRHFHLPPAHFHFPLPHSSHQLPLPPRSPSLLFPLLPPTSPSSTSFLPPLLPLSSPNFLSLLLSYLPFYPPSFLSTSSPFFLPLPSAFLPIYPLSSTPPTYLPSSSSFPSEICYTRVAPRCTRAGNFFKISPQSDLPFGP